MMHDNSWGMGWGMGWGMWLVPVVIILVTVFIILKYRRKK